MVNASCNSCIKTERARQTVVWSGLSGSLRAGVKLSDICKKTIIFSF